MMDHFEPAWAEFVLGSKQDLKAHERAELDMLRAFFSRWEAFHAMPKDKLHRKQQEEAIQELYASAQAIRRLHDPVRMRINGH